MSNASDDIQERELHQLQQMQHKAKESCMKSFRLLQSHLQFIDWQYFLDYDSEMTKEYFAKYTGITVKQFRDKLIQQMENVKKSVAERARHQRRYERRVNNRHMQTQKSKIDTGSALDTDPGKALDASLVVTECSGTKSDKHDTSSSSRTYLTHAVDADIRPVNDQVPFAEVQLTAQHNILANEQQHTDQSEPRYNTYLLEMVDSNNTPDSTNMCHRGGEIDQDAKQYQAKSPLLKPELGAPEFCEFFEINDLKAQLQAKTTLICNLKNQIKSVKEASNEAKVKHEIDVLETINIELESSVAKLLAENEKLNKENEHLKQTYKELYDSIKKTRVQYKDTSDSLTSQINQKSVENADLKAHIQEKVFANAALKNELRKLKGNSVDTKFAKPSILGKPVLQPPRNQSVVRQPNAFKSERPNVSKPRFASQVDVNNVLLKPVIPHYLPKVREYVLAKPHHAIAPGSDRNSQEEPYGSNDMAHNHYLEEVRKKTQERNRNSKPSVMHTTSLQNTTNGSKPNPRSNHQLSRNSYVLSIRSPDTREQSREPVIDKRRRRWNICTLNLSAGTFCNPEKERLGVCLLKKAPLLKEKKSVRFSALFLQKKRNLLVIHNYKAVRLRYSDPMIQPEPEGSTQGYPLVSVEVLRLLIMVVEVPDSTCFKTFATLIPYAFLEVTIQDVQEVLSLLRSERLAEVTIVLSKRISRKMHIELSKSTNQERGKENGLQILQSIDQGPFELGTTRDALGTTPEGGVLLGPERPHAYEDLSDTEKKRYDADVRATNIVLQGLPKDIYKLINHNIEAKAILDNVIIALAGLNSPKEIENLVVCVFVRSPDASGEFQ
ncbi:hypothetical protein Tco_1145126 [Tanacetum coccineum]